MSNQLPWLRIALWTGAIVDLYFGVALLDLPLLQATLQIPELHITPEARLIAGIGASLMFAWATLLFWADRDPQARKGVLLITVFPNVIGLALTALVGLTAGVLTPAGAITGWLLAVALVSLFLTGYRKR